MLNYIWLGLMAIISVKDLTVGSRILPHLLGLVLFNQDSRFLWMLTMTTMMICSAFLQPAV